MSWSIRKTSLLEQHCAAALGPDWEQSSTVGRVSWDQQAEVLWRLAAELTEWRDARFDPRAGDDADHAIEGRVRRGSWPSFRPAVGRYLIELVTSAIAVIVANGEASPATGTAMPAGLDGEALTSALLIFWCFELPVDQARFRDRPSGSA